MPSDPTMDFLRDLSDPDKWFCVPNVPVMRPHRREVTDRSGKKRVIEVKSEDLPNIAKTVNAAYESAGVPIRLTIGHTKADPDTDERLQPVVTGYAKGAKAGTFGPKNIPCVLVDMYLRRDTARDVLAQHPFRSMEFDPVEKRIHGVALLTRDPMLDLGVVTYSGDKWIIRYGEFPKRDEEESGDEESGGEPGKKKADEMPGEDVGAVTLDEGDEEGEAMIDGENDPENPMGEDAAYQGFCKMMQRYIASGGLSSLGPMGGAMPQAKMIPAAGEAPAAYQRTQTVSTPNKSDAALAALEKKVKELERQRDLAETGRLLDTVKSAVKFNYQREQDYLLTLPADKRGDHVQYMLETYQPTAEHTFGGRMLEVENGQVIPKGVTGKNGLFDEPDHYAETMKYMRANPGMQFEHAEAKVLERYQKAGA